MESPGPEVGTLPGEVLDAAQVWARIHARHERALLELDRLIGWSFDRELTDEERSHAGAVAAALARGFEELGLTVAVDLVLQAAATFETETGPRHAAALSALVEDLRTFLAVTGADAAVPAPDAPLVLVVGPASSFVDAALYVASTTGLRARYEPGPPEHDVDAACVLVVCDETEPEIARELFRMVAERLPCCPLVFVAAAAPLGVRLAVAPWAASMMVGVSPREVVAEAHVLVRRDRARSALAVFGNGAEALAVELSGRGIETTAFAEVAPLVDALRSQRAQALLLTAGVERSTRLAVCALIGCEPETRRAGIVAMLDELEPAVVTEVMRAGACTVFPADVDVDVLVSACRARLQRAIDFETRLRPVTLDGSFSQTRATLLIERMLLAAYRARSPVSIGVVTFDPGALDDEHFAALAEPLAREFRREDVIGRWDGKRYVIALKGVGRRTAVRRFEELLKHLGVGGHCRVGVAEFPHDGRAFEELLGVAEASVARARFDEGPRVVSSEWHAAPERGPDVLLVDPDVTLRALVMTLLERQGMAVVQLNDGVSAFEYLTGARDHPLPRSIVMELDLMGIDGLQLLRRLRDAGVLGRLRVLVLTSRIRESELMEALNLGVSDVVTKPFSPGLLVHRLRRVMEA
jgi:DNA-binding response OmpR family regulator